MCAQIEGDASIVVYEERNNGIPHPQVGAAMMDEQDSFAWSAVILDLDSNALDAQFLCPH